MIIVVLFITPYTTNDPAHVCVTVTVMGTNDQKFQGVILQARVYGTVEEIVGGLKYVYHMLSLITFLPILCKYEISKI